MFDSSVNFAVGEFVLCFFASEAFEVFLEVCLCEEDAGTVGAFVLAVAVVFFSHVGRLVDVKVHFFAI